MKLRRIIAMTLVALLCVSTAPALERTAQAAYSMPYYITVDLTNQIVTVYSTISKAIVRQMLCSTGLNNATPKGTYYMPEKTEDLEREEWYYFSSYSCYAHYASRIYKGVLFHSIPCSRKSDASISKTGLAALGQPASHGCVRLRWQDAEFIAKCCLPGTRVKIFESDKRNSDLRDMLLVASYTNEKGQTYNEYLGISEEEGVLGRFSKGSEVRDLQTRLRDLGIFNKKIDGKYLGTTVNAVREAQRLMGEEESGIATLEFQSAIYANDAPTAQNVPVREGMSGPVVRNIQQDLKTLKLYDGDIDGVFDVDVLEAAKKFQGSYGYPTDGVLTPVIQKALYYEAGKLKSMLEQDSDYDCEIESSQMYMGLVIGNVGIRVREKPKPGASSVDHLVNGDRVLALEHGDEWSRVQRGTNVGYVRNMSLEYYPVEICKLSYTGRDTGATYTIGYTSKEYFEGVKIPAEVFEDYLASDGSLDNYEGISTYAKVNTADPSVTLNLRQSPSTASEVLAELPYETRVKVLLRSSEWSLVEWEGQNGYLLNQYLEFWAATGDMEEEGEDIAVESAEKTALLAEVMGQGGKAPVYDSDSDDGEVLGHLKNGTRLQVLETVDGWSHISYQDHTGYMKDADLQFMLTEEVSA